MGRNFTQIERAYIGGPESARVTDIPGAVSNLIKTKIENIIEMIVFQCLYEQAHR